MIIYLKRIDRLHQGCNFSIIGWGNQPEATEIPRRRRFDMDKDARRRILTNREIAEMINPDNDEEDKTNVEDVKTDEEESAIQVNNQVL